MGRRFQSCPALNGRLRPDLDRTSYHPSSANSLRMIASCGPGLHVDEGFTRDTSRPSDDRCHGTEADRRSREPSTGPYPSRRTNFNQVLLLSPDMGERNRVGALFRWRPDSMQSADGPSTPAAVRRRLAVKIAVAVPSDRANSLRQHVAHLAGHRDEAALVLDPGHGCLGIDRTDLDTAIDFPEDHVARQHSRRTLGFDLDRLVGHLGGLQAPRIPVASHVGESIFFFHRGLHVDFRQHTKNRACRAPRACADRPRRRRHR